MEVTLFPASAFCVPMTAAKHGSCRDRLRAQHMVEHHSWHQQCLLFPDTSALTLRFQHPAHVFLRYTVGYNCRTADPAGARGGCKEPPRPIFLEDELAVQVLGDGTHDERSPIYQASIGEALLRLAGVARTSPQESAAKIAAAGSCAGQALLTGLDHLTHPDGEYALVNDSVLGQAPTLAQLQERYGDGTKESGHAWGAWALPNAGYLGWRGRMEGYLCFDAGPIGPDHCPAHGHADMLSFELSHRGRRLVTDTGVYAYSVGPTRLYDRGTAAHNTLQIDCRNQSDVWSSFRCGQRARIQESVIRPQGGGITISGSYRGWLARFSRVEHCRELRVHGTSFRFLDQVLAPGSHEAALRLHLAPGLDATGPPAALRVVDEAGTELARVFSDDLQWQVTTSPYHPRFGEEIERVCVLARRPFEDSLRIQWQIELL